MSTLQTTTGKTTTASFWNRKPTMTLIEKIKVCQGGKED